MDTPPRGTTGSGELDQALEQARRPTTRSPGTAVRDGELPGYPAGIAGDWIPLGAPIIAVVDGFDAMTTDCADRRAVSADRAVEELRAESGRQLVPAVVRAFLAVLEERPWG